MTDPSERSGDLAEGARGVGIERQGLEVGLGLLEVGESGGALSVGRRDEGTDRQLGERDGGDEWG